MDILLVYLTVAIFIGSALAETYPASSGSPARHWASFKIRHHRKYHNFTEERRRFAIFSSNLAEVWRQNALYAIGKTSFRLDTYKFSDLTHAEIAEAMAGYEEPPADSGDNIDDYDPSARDLTRELPDHIDWRDSDAISAVKDQGACSSCWAFSAVGAIESHLFLYRGRRAVLSEQQLLDCTLKSNSSYKNLGCQGGWMEASFKYVKENGGIEAEATYPYMGKVGECQADSSRRPVEAMVSGYVVVGKSKCN